MEHEHTKKASVIIGICILLVAVFSAVILYKTLRPNKGLPYEQITMEQAAEYMEYETDYLLVDVRTQEEYETGHIPGAVCIPAEALEDQAEELLPDREQMIYVYGGDAKASRSAAAKLCDMEYTNITEIGSIEDWQGETENGR